MSPGRSRVGRVLDDVAVGDVLIYALSKVAPGLAGLAMVVVFVRLLGAADYGRYALAFSIASTCSMIAIGWLNQSQLRLWSLYESDRIAYDAAVRRGFRTSLLVVGVAGSMVLLLLAVGFGGPGVGEVLVTMALCVAIMGHLLRASHLQAKISPRDFVRLETLRAFGSVIFPLLLVTTLGPDHRLLLLGVACGYGATRVFGTPWQGRVDGRSEASARIMERMWSYGWPITLWLGGMQLFLVIDRTLVTAVLGYETTGIYAGAYDIVMKVYALLYYPIAIAIHPRVMKAWNAGESSDAMRAVRSALTLQAVLFIPILAGYAFFGDRLLEILVPGYGGSVGGLAVPLAAAGLLWQAALLTHKGLEVRNATRYMLFAMIVALSVNAAVDYFGLPRFGIRAAPFATLSAALSYNLMCLAYYRFGPATPLHEASVR